jgi:hypothetical protein
MGHVSIALLYSEISMNNITYKKELKNIILNQLQNGMKPHWFITYHYKDNKTSEDDIIHDIHDIKNKLRRIAYQNRDRSIIGAGSYCPPKMIFVNERSRFGTDQYHTHMIIEQFPAKINTQATVEMIFKKDLPSKVKSMSKWKRIDVQRISTDDHDIHKLARYLSKQNTLHNLTLDPFNSDF